MIADTERGGAHTFRARKFTPSVPNVAEFLSCGAPRKTSARHGSSTSSKPHSARSAISSARHIPGARFVELPGIDHLPFAGDQEPVLREIEEFVRALSS